VRPNHSLNRTARRRRWRAVRSRPVSLVRLGSMSTSRRALIFVALLATASFMIPAVPILFLRAFGPFTSYGSVPWYVLADWAYLAVCFLAIGAFLPHLLNTSNAAPWATAFGVIYSLTRWLNSSYGFGTFAPLLNYLWLFGGLLVPIVSVLLGAMWAQSRAQQKQSEHHAA
jgi:hypothetical protein